MILQNESSTWDLIWDKTEIPDIDNLNYEIIQSKNSEIWRHYTFIVESKFGGWKNVTSIELGSGMGWHSILAASEGANVYLLDYSEAALVLAKKRFEILGLTGNFILGDAFDINANRITLFNLSWSFGTVEHFNGQLRQSFFDLHFEYIVKGGLAIISSPYKYAINYRIWMHYAQKYNCWEFGLEMPYSKTEFSRKLQASGHNLIEYKFDVGRPCLRKVIKIFKDKSYFRYLTLGSLLKIWMKLNIKLKPFLFRSIILIAEKV